MGHMHIYAPVFFSRVLIMYVARQCFHRWAVTS
jgi:hypothetical protein